MYKDYWMSCSKVLYNRGDVTLMLYSYCVGQNSLLKVCCIRWVRPLGAVATTVTTTFLPSNSVKLVKLTVKLLLKRVMAVLGIGVLLWYTDNHSDLAQSFSPNAKSNWQSLELAWRRSESNAETITTRAVNHVATSSHREHSQFWTAYCLLFKLHTPQLLVFIQAASFPVTSHLWTVSVIASAYVTTECWDEQFVVCSTQVWAELASVNTRLVSTVSEWEREREREKCQWNCTYS